MKVQFAFATLLAVWASSSFALPAPHSGHGFKSNSTTPISEAAAATSSAPSSHQTGGEEYVVIFNNAHPTVPQVAEVLSRIELSPSHSDVKYTFNNTAFRGFVANMKSHCIDKLVEMEDVSHVEKSVAIAALTENRSGAPWGLQRVSSSQEVTGDKDALDFTYSFDDDKLGQGVDIYIVDTGVRLTHAAFGGRAKLLWSFEADTSDGEGHGTHVAGTAAGAPFGVASGANIWAVKVLGATGSGSTSDTISGMDKVIAQHNAQKSQPGFIGSIMSMSWGITGISPAIDTAIQSAIGAGIHVSVAAGNSGADACNFSPADNGGGKNGTVTVGSIGITDGISSFSNTGKCVDIYAPGENVISSWNTADNVINTLSGTSMATPHVTGVMAYMMAKDTSLAADPAKLKAALLQTALAGSVSGTADGGDQKLLLNNGVTSPAKILRRAVRTPASHGVKGLFWRKEVQGLKFEMKMGEPRLVY